MAYLSGVMKLLSLFFKKNSFISLVILSSLLFFVAVIFDISPYLRGPEPYAPEWQWAYLFINTLDKAYVPLFFISVLLLLFIVIEKKKQKTFLSVPLFLSLIVILYFLFELSVIYFSRHGIFVLLHRIINPEINGYFTAALPINDPIGFLANYNDNVLSFVYHAKAHPPGAILLFFYIKDFLSLFPAIGEIVSKFTPTTPDVNAVWTTLLPVEKATAVFSAGFIPFLSALSVIPLYYGVKILYDAKIALRAIFIFIFFPNIILFTPINDAFLHLFTALALFFMALGIKTGKSLYYFFSGAVLFLGVFFNLSFLPLLIFFFFFYILSQYKEIRSALTKFLRNGISYTVGFFLPPILLFALLGFNFLEMIHIIMGTVPDVHTRSYSLWVYYNIQDFLTFCGIPTAIVLLSVFKQQLLFSFRLLIKKINPVALSFFIMILVLNFSGSSRGEVSRIWLPFMPIVAIIAAAYLTKHHKLSTKLFATVLFLQAIQIIVMQEFWVTLW